MNYAHIVGWGSYLPERVVSNDAISTVVETSDEWIFTRTGIRERRVATGRESTTMMAFQAAARALAVANILPRQVDLIIVATSTSDHIFPSTANLVQDLLGAPRAAAFDLSAACAGFVYALGMGSDAIRGGSANTVLVIGSESMSRIIDWSDRGTCILFGDGAGAVVLQGSADEGGVLSSTLRSDGSGHNLLHLPIPYDSPIPFNLERNVFARHHKNTLTMNGRQVFRFATRVVAESITEVLEKAGLTVEDVALVVPHQANIRIIQTAAKRLKLNAEVFYTNVDRMGNTSAASIPIALCEAVDDGLLKPDDYVVFVGFGGGLSWGASVIQWASTAPSDVPDTTNSWRDIRYVGARIRSWLRRAGRGILSAVLGSPTRDARLRDLDKK